MLMIVEWSACLFGVLGALLLAMNNRWSGYGFVLFLCSNAGWATFAVMTGSYGLLTSQAVFTGTSLLGIWQWLVRPRLEARRAAASLLLSSLRTEYTQRAYDTGRRIHG